MIHLSTAIRWLITAEASSGRAFLFTGTQSHHLVVYLYLHFDTAADDVNSSGRTDETINQGNIQNHGFDRLQSPIGSNRSQDSFPDAPIDPGSMDSSTDESVI